MTIYWTDLYIIIIHVNVNIHADPDNDPDPDNDGTLKLGVKTISGSVVTHRSEWHTYESFEWDVLMLSVIFIIF